MSSRSVKLALFGAAALLIACAAGLMLGLLQPRLFRHQWARQRWEQRKPQHYEFEVSLTAIGFLNQHLRVEARDGQIVGGVDLDTGQPLDLNKLGFARALRDFLSIDSLFDLIDTQARRSPEWRQEIARYHPLLARWLNVPCPEPLPDVAYDAEFGYPVGLHYRSNPCIAMLSIRTDVKVKIERFRPLP
jgi:hypothetical protein